MTLVDDLQDKEETLIKMKDLRLIQSVAIREYNNFSGSIYLTQTKMEQKDLVHIALANSLIMWLNNKGLLKNLVRFDYTDDSSDYEGIEE